MTKIIGICGAKRSGKNTTANFLHGHVLKEKEIIREFNILENGELSVNTHYIDDNGDVQEEMGVLDLTQQNESFFGFAQERIWPHIKLYHFADALKEICMTMFGLTYEQAYGLDKDSPTKLRWENMPGVVTPEKAIKFGQDNNLWNIGYTPTALCQIFQDLCIIHEAGSMSAREVLQFVGTEIFRKMHGSVWIDIVINAVKADQPEIAVIADCRFDNEAIAIKENGGILIGLSRRISEDSHSSENSLNYSLCDIVINNQNMTIRESNNAVLSYLKSNGII
jgi:hypothetical protein